MITSKINVIKSKSKLIQKKNVDMLKKGPQGIHLTDFNLSGGCFGTGIIQNCTKWSNMGVHGLSLGPFVAKLRCASFLIRKNQEK